MRPTGLSIKNSEIEELLKQDSDRLVIIDEAYVDYADDNAISLLKSYDNLLIIRTLSKSYSLAGARIGLALGSPRVIKDLNTIKFSFNPYNLNRLSIKAGAAALGDRVYFDQCIAKVRKQRSILTCELRTLGFSVLDSSANFIFAGANPKLAAENWFGALREKGILVRYFGNKRTKEYLRISIGSAEDTRTLLNATKEILAG